jgi:Sulfotransferase domain
VARFLKPLKAKWREATSRSRVLPDFLMIGAQRCGTTTLYQYLAHHPCIVAAAKKEIGFFDNHFEKGINWYRAQFPTEREKQAVLKRQKIFLTGEASINYLIRPAVPGRVAVALPQVKLIVLLRDPVVRTYSGYNRMVRKKCETRTFREVIESELPQPLAGWNKLLNDPDHDYEGLSRNCYLARGLYAEQLRWWMKFFPRERFLVLNSEFFFKQPFISMNRVCDFLGIPAWSEESFRETAEKPVQKWLARKYSYSYPPLEKELRERLVEFFRPHNQRLYELVGQDFGWKG